MRYFPHDCSAFDDEKIQQLYMRFGYEGLGLFYTILEKVAKQEKPVKTEVLKHQLFVRKRLEKCWQFMEEIGIISSSNGETFNENVLNNSEKYLIKKEKTRERVLQFRDREKDTKNVTRYNHDGNAPKDKIIKDKISNTALAFASEVFKKAWEEWELFRVQKKQKLTDLTVKKQNAFLEKFDEETAIKILSQSIEKGWSGLFEIKNSQNGTNHRTTSGNSKSAGAYELAEQLNQKLAARGTTDIGG